MFIFTFENRHKFNAFYLVCRSRELRNFQNIQLKLKRFKSQPFDDLCMKDKTLVYINVSREEISCLHFRLYFYRLCPQEKGNS